MRGIEERTGDGSASQDGDGEDDLHDLPGYALPRDGPQAEPDGAHVAPVADAAVDVAEDPAGEREVEELRPVVRRDGSRKREAEVEAAGDDPPPPGTANRRHRADHRSGRQRRAVHRTGPVEERADAQAPDDDGERRRSARQARCPQHVGRSSMILPPRVGRPGPNRHSRGTWRRLPVRGRRSSRQHQEVGVVRR